MAKYKVIEEIEILGELRTIGLEIEIDEETAAPFVSDGALEPVPEEPTPPAPPSGESTAGESTTPPPPTGEKPKDWAGGHSV
jgi:hypothetical protein